MFYLSLILNQHSSTVTKTMSNKRPGVAVQRATAAAADEDDDVSQRGRATQRRRDATTPAAAGTRFAVTLSIEQGECYAQNLFNTDFGVVCRVVRRACCLPTWYSAWMASECKRAGGWIVVCIYIYIYNFIFSLSFCSFFSSPWNKLDLAKTAIKARDATLLLQGRRARVRRVRRCVCQRCQRCYCVCSGDWLAGCGARNRVWRAGGRRATRKRPIRLARHINNGAHNDAPLPTTADVVLCMVAVVIAKEREEQGAQRRAGDDESGRVVE